MNNMGCIPKCDLCHITLEQESCILIHEPQDDGLNKVRCGSHSPDLLAWHSWEHCIICVKHDDDKNQSNQKKFFIPIQHTDLNSSFLNASPAEFEQYKQNLTQAFPQHYKQQQQKWSF
jgi:hypothetical protein